jgi:hypothetical protein
MVKICHQKLAKGKVHLTYTDSVHTERAKKGGPLSFEILSRKERKEGCIGNTKLFPVENIGEGENSKE